METPRTVQVTDKVISMLGMGRVFKDNTAPINSLDFHRTEDLLITGSDDDSIRVYNTAKGQLMETLFSRKYGVSNICITHASSCAVYATRKPPVNSQITDWYSLRYHDLQRNEYVRYFRGHTASVTTLAMSPKNDTFLSAGLDKTMRLWDLRTTICQGIMSVPGVPCASFDQQGLVFAVATETGIIKLYDVRSYEKGPFDTFMVAEEAGSPPMSSFTDLRFSNDGKYMLGVVDNRVYVLDAFQGTVLRKFSTGNTEQPMEAAFSADNNYVLSGCDDRSIRVWNINTGQLVVALQGHAGHPARIKFAPRRLLVASACQALTLWIPPPEILEDPGPL